MVTLQHIQEEKKRWRQWKTSYMCLQECLLVRRIGSIANAARMEYIVLEIGNECHKFHEQQFRSCVNCTSPCSLHHIALKPK